MSDSIENGKISQGGLHPLTPHQGLLSWSPSGAAPQTPASAPELRWGYTDNTTAQNVIL